MSDPGDEMFDYTDYPEGYGNDKEYECDCCGKMKHGCTNIVWHGMDVHACPACLGDVDDEPSGRGGIANYYAGSAGRR